jgi:transcriptional regulator with XRE-family HTH domain
MTENKPTKAPEKFIRLLKKAMDEHPEELSLRQVAKRADISPAYLSLLLNGERGVPSNDAIRQLEDVLGIPDGELFKAAARPDDQALEFFRKDDAGSIMRTLAPLPNSQLSAVRKLIEQFVEKQKHTKGK